MQYPSVEISMVQQRGCMLEKRDEWTVNTTWKLEKTREGSINKGKGKGDASDGVMLLFEQSHRSSPERAASGASPTRSIHPQVKWERNESMRE